MWQLFEEVARSELAQRRFFNTRRVTLPHDLRVLDNRADKPLLNRDENSGSHLVHEMAFILSVILGSW